MCFKRGVQWHQVYECSNRGQEIRVHIAKGDKSWAKLVVWDNIHGVQQEHGENLMFSRVLLKLEWQHEDRVGATKWNLQN